jgi:hypothetical protein
MIGGSAVAAAILGFGALRGAMCKGTVGGAGSVGRGDSSRVLTLFRSGVGSRA